MKRVETLSGKNLPRLAVAKPGWLGPIITAIDVGYGNDWTVEVDYQEKSDGTLTIVDERSYRTTIENEPSTVTPQAVADFTRVCDQTEAEEGLRMSELLSCPFCAGVAALKQLAGNPWFRFQPVCTNCGTTVGFFDGSDEEKVRSAAIKFWNTRAALTPAKVDEA